MSDLIRKLKDEAKGLKAKLKAAGISSVHIIIADGKVSIDWNVFTRDKVQMLNAIKDSRKKLGSDLDVQLERIEAKILDGLRKESPAGGMFGFVSFLLKHLSQEDHATLERFERERDDYNEWLQDIMVRSGKYTADGETVQRSETVLEVDDRISAQEWL